MNLFKKYQAFVLAKLPKNSRSSSVFALALLLLALPVTVFFANQFNSNPSSRVADLPQTPPIVLTSTPTPFVFIPTNTPTLTLTPTLTPTFTPTPSPKPTFTPTPTPVVKVTGSAKKFKPTGATKPGTKTLTWTAIPRATEYYVIIDNKANGWNPNTCATGNGNKGDKCAKVFTNSYTYTFVEGLYTWGVYGQNSAGAGPLTGTILRVSQSSSKF